MGGRGKYRVMDVVYLDILRGPRGLVVEVCGSDVSRNRMYTVISEGDGYHSVGEDSLMTLEEWEKFFSWAADELTGREFREIMEAARGPLVEPESWAGFRARYAETGDPWLRE